jgi:hypothetical protein
MRTCHDEMLGHHMIQFSFFHRVIRYRHRRHDLRYVITSRRGWNIRFCCCCFCFLGSRCLMYPIQHTFMVFALFASVALRHTGVPSPSPTRMYNSPHMFIRVFGLMDLMPSFACPDHHLSIKEDVYRGSGRQLKHVETVVEDESCERFNLGWASRIIQRVSYISLNTPYR